MNKKIKEWITLFVLAPTLFSCNSQPQNMIEPPKENRPELPTLPNEAQQLIYNEILYKRNSITLQLLSRDSREYYSNVYQMGYIVVENDDNTSKNYKLANLKKTNRKNPRRRKNTHYLSGALI